jgi:hypothetical protein
MDQIKDETRLSKICQKCFYRRATNRHGIGEFYYGNSKNNSYCAFLLIEDEPRGCTPTENECARFKPRTRTKSLTGKIKMIK